MRRPALIALALVTGCSSAQVTRAPCTTDQQCGAGQVCFADGCGNPGENLAMEVVPNSQGGSEAQDFLITVKGTQDIQLAPPAAIYGSVVRPTTMPTGPAAYTGTVSFAATGQSALIPGRPRTYQTTIDLSATRGAYQLPVGSGLYSLSATAGDLSIPPVTLKNIAIAPGAQQQEAIAFAGLNSTSVQVVDGTLWQTLAGGVPLPGIQLVAQDPGTGLPLSQPAVTTLQGTFRLYVATTAGQTFQIHALPADATALVPSKTFTVTPGTAPLSLELGAFGPPVSATGTVLGANGKPVAGAVVYVEGTVTGGGTYRSAPVLTDAAGAFTLATLTGDPSTPNALALWAFPPTASTSGVLSAPYTVSGSTYTCPARVQLEGTLLNTNGSPSVGATVVCNVVSVPPGARLGEAWPQVVTDAQGRFALPLDPALYRLDFLPASPDQPRASRFVQVVAQPGLATQTLESTQLSVGRTLNGRLTIATGVNGQAAVMAPSATIRLFRLATVGEVPVSYPVAETTSGVDGSYQVVLPTH